MQVNNSAGLGLAIALLVLTGGLLPISASACPPVRKAQATVEDQRAGTAAEDDSVAVAGYTLDDSGRAISMESIQKQGALRQTMRKLWTDHVVWTREFIIAALSDSPGTDFAAARLMQNQEDIGNAAALYYGRAAGDQLTTLLKEHISIAAALVPAAKAGDVATFKTQNAAWQRNSEEIASFLSSANPHWPRTTLSQMMQAHLTTTAAELQARLDEDWEADIQAYDAVYNHILMMSDALSDGIIKQFPDKF